MAGIAGDDRGVLHSIDGLVEFVDVAGLRGCAQFSCRSYAGGVTGGGAADHAAPTPGGSGPPAVAGGFARIAGESETLPSANGSSRKAGVAGPVGGWRGACDQQPTYRDFWLFGSAGG